MNPDATPSTTTLSLLWPYIPTLVNTIAVFLGAAIGLLFYGKMLPRYRQILFQALGLVTLIIGLRDALQTETFPILALSMILGGLTGEWINIEERLQSIGTVMKNKIGFSDHSQFVDAYVYASILFCVGAMTVVGTFRAATFHDGDILYTKSLMDGHAAIFLTSAMGAGVMASAVTVLLFQGLLTFLFQTFASELPAYVMAEVTAAGGLLIMGIALNLLDIAKIRVGNLLPGMLYAGLLVWLWQMLSA